jgi:hypothetical protein
MPAPVYGPSVTNVHKIKTETKGKKITVNLKEFSAAPKITNEIVCRGAGPVVPSPGKTFAKYIRDAIFEEFVLAGIYDSNSNIIIDGKLEKIDFSSFEDPSWQIEMTIFSSNGKSIVISEKFPFEAGFMGDVACRNVSYAFAPAVQSLINKFVTHSEFIRMVSIENQVTNARQAQTTK